MDNLHMESHEEPISASSRNCDLQSYSNEKLEVWIIKALENTPDHGGIIEDLRPFIWQEIPTCFRDSYIALIIGDSISRTLRKIDGVGYDSATHVWYLKKYRKERQELQELKRQEREELKRQEQMNVPLF